MEGASPQEERGQRCPKVLAVVALQGASEEGSLGASRCLFWQRLRRRWAGRAGSSQGLSGLQEWAWRLYGVQGPVLLPARPQGQALKLNKERSPQPAPGQLFSKQQNPRFREKREWFSEKPTYHGRQVKWT